MDDDDERKITSKNYEHRLEHNNVGVTIYHDPYKLIIHERGRKKTKTRYNKKKLLEHLLMMK